MLRRIPYFINALGPQTSPLGGSDEFRRSALPATPPHSPETPFFAMGAVGRWGFPGQLHPQPERSAGAVPGLPHADRADHLHRRQEPGAPGQGERAADQLRGDLSEI